MESYNMGNNHKNSENGSEHLRKSRRATIYFEPSVHTRLRLLSASSGRSISDIVNDTIKISLDDSTSLLSTYEEVSAVDDHISESTPVYNDLIRRVKDLETVIRTPRKTELIEPSDEDRGGIPSLDKILQQISGHTVELKRMGVKSLSLFGSIIRDEAGPESDIDVLAEFSEPVGYFHVFKLKKYLEHLLNHQVDLTTPGSLRPEIAELVLSEAVNAF